MSELSRSDENWRAELLERESGARQPPLTEAEQCWLSLLNDRYEKFVAEGLEAMKAQLPSSKGGPSLVQSAAASVSSIFSKLGRFANLASAQAPAVTNDSFDGTTGDPAEGGGGTADAPHRSARHWTWFLNNKLAIGAVPLADPAVSDPSGHLRGVKFHCKERGVKLGLVVSACDSHVEFVRDGDRLGGFATPHEWESALGVQSFAELALPEEEHAAVEIPPEDTLNVCRTMNEVISAPNRAVFLHCKAGKFRCWCIAMCFLVTQRGMSFDQAQETLRRARPQMTGGAMHALYVQQVADYAVAHPPPVAAGGGASAGGATNATRSPAPLSPTVAPAAAVLSPASASLSLDDARSPLALSRAGAAAPDGSLSFSAGAAADGRSPSPTNSSFGVNPENEAKYNEILAELLGLPAIYRQRLITDLERLT